MTCCPLCQICEELRAAVLEATYEHMTALMRINDEEQAAGSHGTGDLERWLEQSRLRRDDAVRSYETHRRVHAEVALIG